MLQGNSSGSPSIDIAQVQRIFARVQLAFAVIFTLGALGGIVFGVIRPIQQMRAAQQWAQTPCVITRSVVVRGIGKSSTKRPSHPTYTLALAYQYQFQGKPYQGRTYSFDVTELTGLNETHRASKRFPVGSQTVCWVNPAQPEESVLLRDAQLPALLMLIPVVLTVAGVAMGLNALKTLRG